jgi:hypothetical protein
LPQLPARVRAARPLIVNNLWSAARPVPGSLVQLARFARAARPVRPVRKTRLAPGAVRPAKSYRARNTWYVVRGPLARWYVVRSPGGGGPWSGGGGPWSARPGGGGTWSARPGGGGPVVVVRWWWSGGGGPVPAIR